MSAWTHVNASIRIDSLKGLVPPFDKSKLGTVVEYGDVSPSDNPMPVGSEGSLNYTFWDNPSESSMAAYTVNIFGDLRDFTEFDEIIQYLEGITDKEMIRSGVAEISNHFERVVVLYNSEEMKWKRVFSESTY